MADGCCFTGHRSVPEDWTMSAADWKDFVDYAKTKDFDYRSSAKTYFDLLKKELDKDGLSDSMKDQVEAMQKALEMDKETFLNLKKDEIEIVVQINGKVRHRMHVASDLSREELSEQVLADEAVRELTDGKSVKKVVAVPGKLVNIVVA